jgi:HlyD family secretion protein
MSAVLDDQHMQRLLDRLSPAAPGAEPAGAPRPDAASVPTTRPTRRRWAMPATLAVAVVAVAAAFVAGRQTQTSDAESASRLATQAASSATPAALTPASTAPAGDGVLLQASGYVVAERQATVSAEVTGRLAALHVHAGDHVKRGQLLAELDPSALDAQIALADAELAAQRGGQRELGVQIEQARAALARTQALVDQGFVSQQQVENERYRLTLLESQRDTHDRQVEVAQRQLQLRREFASQLRVLAPFDGIVTESAAQVGEIVSPISAGAFTRSGICTLVDLHSLLVEVKVNEKFIQRVRDGQAVRVSLQADASAHQEGRVSAVMPAAERETGTVKVRISLPNPDARILPNMGVDVAFLGRETVNTPSGASR